MDLLHYPSRLKCITILFFFLNITLATALSFNFSSFASNVSDLIIYEGSAQLSANNSIQLTPSVPQSVGHATYAEPLHLWDRASRNLTDFTTHFSFVIDSSNMTNYGDGFTFFLAPNDSSLQDNRPGGSLGLTNLPWNSTDMHFTAVEFDIHSNEGVDPVYEHVGINVNAIRSEGTMRWLNANSSIMEGRPQEALINYDSQSRNLSVVFTGFSNGSSVTQGLSHIVDLREYLPEFVTFGFSAATGGAAVVQNINSWSFSSDFGINDNATYPNPGPVTPPLSSPVVPDFNNSGSRKIGPMIALVVGGLGLGFII